MSGEQSRTDFVPALTGLRGVGALWALGHHLFLAFPIPIAGRGYLGVDLFFILSGFVLTRVHKRDFEDGYSLSKYGRFLLLRIARIYPLHLFILLLFGTVVTTLPGFTTRYAHPEYFSWQQFLATAFLIQNWRMGLVSAWNSPSWSLSAEWLAYIAFPFAIFVASTSCWKYKPVLAALALLVMMLICAAAGDPGLGIAGVIGLLRMAAEFFAGCLICQFVTDARSASLRWPIISALSIVSIAFGVLFPPVLWLSIFGFVGLIATVAVDNGVATRVLSARPIVFIGEISFSVYLSHSPIIQIRNYINDTVVEMNWALSTIALVPIIFVVSALTWRYIEKPGRAAGRRFIERRWPIHNGCSRKEAT